MIIFFQNGQSYAIFFYMTLVAYWLYYYIYKIRVQNKSALKRLEEKIVKKKALNSDMF